MDEENVQPLNLASSKAWTSPSLLLIDASRDKGQLQLRHVLGQCGHRFGAAFCFSYRAAFAHEEMGEMMQAACCFEEASLRDLRDVLRFQQWADDAHLSVVYTLVVLDHQEHRLLEEARDLVQQMQQHPHITLVCMTKTLLQVPSFVMMAADAVIIGHPPLSNDDDSPTPSLVLHHQPSLLDQRQLAWARLSGDIRNECDRRRVLAYLGCKSLHVQCRTTPATTRVILAREQVVWLRSHGLLSDAMTPQQASWVAEWLAALLQHVLQITPLLPTVLCDLIVAYC
jgi:hypothetical protein